MGNLQIFASIHEFFGYIGYDRLTQTYADGQQTQTDASKGKYMSYPNAKKQDYSKLNRKALVRKRNFAIGKIEQTLKSAEEYHLVCVALANLPESAEYPTLVNHNFDKRQDAYSRAQKFLDNVLEMDAMLRQMKPDPEPGVYIEGDDIIYINDAGKRYTSPVERRATRKLLALPLTDDIIKALHIVFSDFYDDDYDEL